MSLYTEIELTTTEATLQKLEELNAASKLGYDAGRVLRAIRDVRPGRKEDLIPVKEFVDKALGEIRALFPPNLSRKPTAYAPGEVVRRFVRQGGTDRGEVTTTPEEKLGELHQLSLALSAIIEGQVQINGQIATNIYTMVFPLYEAYVEAASQTAEDLTTV